MSVTTIAAAMPTDTLSNMRSCAHCQLRYDWRKSPSGCLKMTYCGSLCERADLGFTIDALLSHSPRTKTERRPERLLPTTHRGEEATGE